MNNKKLIRFVESFVLLPIVTVSMPVSNITKDNYDFTQVPQIVLSQKQNIEANGLLAFNQVIGQKANDLKSKADAIDTFYKEHNMPLEGMGMKMVEEAKKNEIDWRLLPAISVVESTGGRHACKRVTNSFFGWGSCKINFKSKEAAIEIVAKNLGGNNPNTDQHYADKTTKEILQKYNSVIPTYATKVMNVMNEIGDEDMTVETTSKA